MDRRFGRSLFPYDPFFDDPFFSDPFRHRPLRVHHHRPLEMDHHEPLNDAYQIFDSFFKQNGIREGERNFFERHYPERVEKKFDPYEVLGVVKGAADQQVKRAYRQKSIRYHPKNDPTLEAEKKFVDLSRAYQMLTSKESQMQKSQSFMDEFNRTASFIANPQGRRPSSRQPHQSRSPRSTLKTYEPQEPRELKQSESYFESTSMQNNNGKKRVNIQREYRKDDKALKIKREEKYREDGTKEVFETFDDGSEVKQHSFVDSSGFRRLEH